MLNLVFAHRHAVAAVNKNVGGLKHRIIKESGVHGFGAIGLILKLRHAL